MVSIKLGKVTNLLKFLFYGENWSECIAKFAFLIYINRFFTS